jgi:hypothetical protein
MALSYQGSTKGMIFYYIKYTTLDKDIPLKVLMFVNLKVTLDGDE